MERSYYQDAAERLLIKEGPAKVRRVLAMHRKSPMPGISESYIPALQGVLDQREAA